MLENTSESEEEGDYVLGVDAGSNPEGLRVLVGGQPLTSEVRLRYLPFGGTKTVVEVYRTGEHVYDFSQTPLVLYMASACQDTMRAEINLKPVFLRTCAPIDFHNSMQTFAASYVLRACVLLVLLSYLFVFSVYSGFDLLELTNFHVVPQLGSADPSIQA